MELGHLAATQLEARTIAIPYMQKLKEQLNEAVQLVIIDRDEAIYIEKVESDKPVRLYTKTGKTCSVVCRGLSKSSTFISSG